MDSDTIAKIRGSLDAVEKSVELEPMIFIDAKHKYRMNGHARDFIAKREIPTKEFMEWLMIGSSHLQKFSYGDVMIQMMRLPGDNVLVFLKNEAPAKKISRTVLTPKEREVLSYIVKGFSNKKIALVMKIKPGTVNSHLDRIYGKLGCSNRVAAGFLGLKNGLFLPACDKLSAVKN